MNALHRNHARELNKLQNKLKGSELKVAELQGRQGGATTEHPVAPEGEQFGELHHLDNEEGARRTGPRPPGQNLLP